ncbi:MAG: hypothetical protein IGS48_00220 [Oscillatoriales cyanobacterium C42_A2020_001]|nr:hypothetical protein [Leptolyngbyaceae cyanobacterium C42_A2020_001]
MMRNKLLDLGLFVCSALFTGLLFYSLAIAPTSSHISPPVQGEQSQPQSNNY